MKITETRKQIIEIIEPYMDKTLSEGCLVQVLQESYAGPSNGTDCFDMTYYIGKVISIKKEEWFDYDNEEDSEERKKIKERLRKKDNEEYANGNICYSKGYICELGMNGEHWIEVGEGSGSTEEVHKNFGHYDISSVLKYIVKQGGTYNWNCVYLEKISIEYYGEDYQIENKPLHLYTEKEDKELLELLKELGTKK